MSDDSIGGAPDEAAFHRVQDEIQNADDHQFRKHRAVIQESKLLEMYKLVQQSTMNFLPTSRTGVFTAVEVDCTVKKLISHLQRLSDTVWAIELYCRSDEAK